MVGPDLDDPVVCGLWRMAWTVLLGEGVLIMGLVLYAWL